MPKRILDLSIEFRLLSNGVQLSTNKSLLGALTNFGLDGIGSDEKKVMQLAIADHGRSLVGAERLAVLHYCESDVAALARLYPEMEPYLDLPRATLRGRFMAAVARMEMEGIPIDTALHGRIIGGWQNILTRLIAEMDADYGVFDGTVFKRDRFRALTEKLGLWWPELPSGQQCLDRDTFRDMAKVHPVLAPLHELRHSLSDLRLNDLSIGRDGRNRCMLSPFVARSSRNCPSNSHYIFGPAVWLRSIIQPPPGYGIAYIDWSAQEFGIAAALSGDFNMIQAYHSGDAYLGFAKLAGAVPVGATKETHGAVRELYKQNALGVNYGMGEKTLADRIGHLPIFARHLMEQHHSLFPQFWHWSDLCVDHAMLHGWQETVFGWRVQVFPEPNVCSLRNFHMQANGAEMLRLACCLGTENGVRICAPIHDAVLITAPIDQLADMVEAMRGYMAEASRIVLDGFELAIESRSILYPEHYSDKRGAAMFAKVMSLL
jgi:DNA polymerase I-like protein with 3'-5' exonuclease and polymerase domains